MRLGGVAWLRSQRRWGNGGVCERMGDCQSAVRLAPALIKSDPSEIRHLRDMRDVKLCRSLLR